MDTLLILQKLLDVPSFEVKIIEPFPGILAPKMAGEYSAGIIAGAGCALLIILLSVICFLTRR